MSGNTEGTPITKLRNDLVQTVHKVKNDLESNYSMDSIKTSTDIRQLVDEINNNINFNNNNDNDNDDKDKDKHISNDTESSSTKYSKKQIKQEYTDEEVIKKDKKKRKNKKYKVNIIEDSIYDGILLLIIFILMSQHFVKNFIGNYVNIINVNQEGFVPFTGVVTYGIIFVLVFLSTRLLIHKICLI